MIFIEVRCDKCGSVGLSRRCFYAHQMREELKKAGWKHVELLEKAQEVGHG